MKSHTNLVASFNAQILEQFSATRFWYAVNKALATWTAETGHPAFGLGVAETVVVRKPFGNLVRFGEHDPSRPSVMIVAPLSGHYATLIRGTIREFLDHNVYVTDWQDASMVSLDDGVFSLDSYIGYVKDFIRHFDGDLHVVSICQSSVPVLIAVSLLAQEGGPAPKSLTLLGAPIDTRVSPTEVNKLATDHAIEWFRLNLIHRVPVGRPGAGRRVYPGFLQLAGFMSLNLGRHCDAYRQYVADLFAGADDKARQHETFYHEYLSVMDMDAVFYLETIEKVFQEHHLPTGRFVSGGRLVDPAAITATALLTIEGEKDDITGLGQTEAAHGLCPNVPFRRHITVAGAGHYGIFSGRRFRDLVAPAIKDMIRLVS